MSNWKIVTNGKSYRIRHRTSGEFDGKYVSCFVVVGFLPNDFLTLQSARDRVAELDQIDKDNTWVEVK